MIRIATNKYVQNFINKTKNKKFYDSFNRNIPIIETAFSGICYCGAIYTNNNLDKNRKPALYWQTILGCMFGMTISKCIDNSINSFKNNICDSLKNKSNIKNIEKIITGFRIAIPLITVASITRFAIPTLLVPLSTKFEERRKKIISKRNDTCLSD